MSDSMEEFEHRLRVLLPETYQVFDAAVQPRSMGSAGLRYGPDGKVEWDKMWATFCHLAMAGGPPHRGKLLEPFRGSNLTPEQQTSMLAASAEIGRGIGLVTRLCAEPASRAGWLRLYCTSAAMAGWVARAIVMENVTAVVQGLSVFLPTGPHFRVEKEIKNVITSVAKTCHYWQDHMTEAQHAQVAELLAAMDRQMPLLQPGLDVTPISESTRRRIEDEIAQETSFEVVDRYEDWVGLDCGSVAAAIWLMRALAVCNCSARREETILFAPLNAQQDSDGTRVVAALTEATRMARSFGVLQALEVRA
ncbi:hypothetical protein [Terriglobus aquaticus]|uniref:Uncharacterized protein n=1 Tax=Terriglobus aquaticus TaxID=940139 RepID=A0ABW9KN78_9BACT|nr:hypothetical protein [Terriglobus aquaticus]